MPCATVNGPTVFIVEEMVADSPFAVIISDVADAVTFPLHVTFCVVAPPPALVIISPLYVATERPAFKRT